MRNSEPLYQQALAIRKKALGDAAPLLCHFLKQSGRIVCKVWAIMHKQSRSNKEALAIRKKCLGRRTPRLCRFFKQSGIICITVWAIMHKQSRSTKKI
jgi:hypothetical protein